MRYHIYYHGRTAGHFDDFMPSARLDSMKWYEGSGLEIRDDRLMSRLRRMQRLMWERPTEDVDGRSFAAPTILQRGLDRIRVTAILARRQMRQRVIEYLCDQGDFVHLYDIRDALGHRCNWPDFLTSNPVDIALRTLDETRKIRVELTLYTPCFAAHNCKQVLPHFNGYVPVVTREMSTGELSARFLGMAFEYDTPFFRASAPDDPLYCDKCEFDVDSSEFTAGGIPVSHCPHCGGVLNSQIRAATLAMIAT